MSAQAQVFDPAKASVQTLFATMVENLKREMRRYKAVTVGFSAGKDSTCVLHGVIEAARQLKQLEGISVAVRAVTSDTGVELPNQHITSLEMASIFEGYAESVDIDYEQVWVGPSPINSYLVVMLGMRGVMTMPQGSATCSVQMKLDPAKKARKRLAKQFGGAANVLSVSGVRTLESTKRAKNIEKRQESSVSAVVQADGSGLLAPILEWSEEDVWSFLRATNHPASAASHGVPSLCIDPLFLHYEKMKTDTCNIEFLTAAKQQMSKSPCGGGSRGGCFLCGRIGDVDKSMRSLLTHFPAYEPLDRLARIFRAGHYVPANRNWFAKSADENGYLKIFSNAYSASWTSSLLKYVLTIDEDEDRYAMRRREKVAKMKDGPLKDAQMERLKVMGGRRFPRLLTEEQQLLIAFSWSRYGVQAPGEFIRIKEAIQEGKRWPMPTDEEIEALKAQAQPDLMGKTIGYLQADPSFADDKAYRDGWRDLIDADSWCAPDIMRTDTGERAMYAQSNGISHDNIELADEVSADTSVFESEYEYMDWLWLYSIDYADGKRSNNEEMDFLVRSGVIKARPGYHAHLANYQCLNRQLRQLRHDGPLNSLEEIKGHPRFLPVEYFEAPVVPAKPKLIASDGQSATEQDDVPAGDADQQMDLFDVA